MLNGKDLKCLFWSDLTINTMLVSHVRGSMFQILALLNMKEPWYLVVLVSDKGSKS